jgi:hypothetical protein
MSYYIVQNEATKGPYTIGQLRSMWGSGSINGDTLYCEEGYDTWLHMRVLGSELESPQPAPQPAGFSPKQSFDPRMSAGRGHKVKKVEFAGGGAAVQLIGFILCLTLVGVIIGIPLIIIGRSMSTKFLCSQCGNKLSDKAAAICPVCRCQI